MVKVLLKRLWNFFLELNLYKKSSDNEPSSLKDLIATRIYLIASTLLILIILLVATFYPRTITSIEYSQSSIRFAQLLQRYSDTLHCPCTQFSINYGTFASIQTKFHQVCSSEFIEQTWIDKVFEEHNQLTSSFDDHRVTLSFFWQIISHFCSISNITWSDIITGFEGSSIVNPTVITEEFVRNQIKEVITKEQLASQTSLTQNLYLMQRLVNANQYVSGVRTNFQLRYPNDMTSPKMFANKYDNCSCLNIDGCPHAATFYDTNGQLVSIQGMVADCLIIDGTLASTLECYYDQSCISLLHPSLVNTIHPLSNDANKYFHMNSTIQMMFDEIMLDELIENIQYDVYYSQCNPSYCSYSYSRRFDILYVITTIVGLFGTLSMVIRLSAPIVASAFLRWKNKRITNVVVVVVVVEMTLPQQDQGTFFDRVRHFSNYIRQAIISINLFEKQTTRTTTIIYRERLLTRCLIFLMITATIGISFYTFFNKENQIITIHNPSLDTYYQLYTDHSSSLKCPCSKLSFSYEKFLNVSAVLHQLCSSDLISPLWINYLLSFDPNLLSWEAQTQDTIDFRIIGASYFQLMNTFCSRAEDNIKNLQKNLVNTQFISDNVLTPSRFLQETQNIIDLFLNTTKSNLWQESNWIIILLTTSSFLSGTNVNFVATVTNNDIHLDTSVLPYSAICFYDGLFIFQRRDCNYGATLNKCGLATVLYKDNSSSYSCDPVLSNMGLGCIPIYTYLFTDISWLYDNSNIDEIKNTYALVLPSLSVPDVMPLDESIPTHFDSLSFRNLLNEMFIEEWITNDTQFDQFFNECAPSFCSYIIYQRRPIVVVVLLIIAICGGLYKGLYLILSFIGNAVFAAITKWKNRNNLQRDISIVSHIRYFPRDIYRTITNMNLFETEQIGELIEKQQKLYTKVYLVLYISCLSIILFYTAINKRSVTITYQLDSIEQYENLQNLYENDLNCPCSEISVPYDSFITELQVDAFHQVCESEDVSDGATDEIMKIVGEVIHYGHQRDFRYAKLSFFKLILDLCTQAKNNIENSIELFLSSAIISNQLISPNQFNDEINDTINRFQKKIPITFTRTLNLIRTIMQGNALIAFSSANWQFVITEQEQETNTTFLTVPIIHENVDNSTTCSCATSTVCNIPGQLFDDNGTPFYTIQGIVFGCHIFETILHSSLSCFYSNSCFIDLWQASFSKQPIAIFDTEITRFQVDDTIETLASEMFIESWIRNVSYEGYFNSCAPSYCTHTHYYHFDLFELLTTFLSVFGGLSNGIRFVVPYLLGIFIIIRNRFRNTSIS